MDDDSSTKFIGSLTKFLQSLCNGYVEFQRGVELVGHIYLSIDTGEKVDYILHEKVSKNDENSVTFVSNSFHAQPLDKKTGDKDASSKCSARNSRDTAGDDDDDDDDDSDDIMIVDQSSFTPGSTNTGTVPSRSGRHASSSGSVQHAGGSASRQGSSNPVSSPQRNRQQLAPSATVTSRDVQQENINMGEVKLEQISSDELLSLASQVGEGPSQRPHMIGQHGGPSRVKRSSSLGDAAGQPVWIKQEAPDDSHGGTDTGWSHGRDGQSDTSNSGSDLYPVMMHQSSAYSSGPVFPGFSSVSGQSSTAGSHHGHSLPGMSGAANPYANPIPGTSQGMSGIDPAVWQQYEQCNQMWDEGRRRLRDAERKRLYYRRLKEDPEKRRLYNLRKAMERRRREERKRQQLQTLQLSVKDLGGSDN